jgi:two-component system chemotaxis response regulator CheB
MNGKKIRVLIVDDSAFVRKALDRMFSGTPDMTVVGLARDGAEGLEMARELQPDVVTLDMKMPRLGGLETIERLMATQPVRILMLSSLTQEGAEITLRGLELGALDFVDKTSVQGPMNLLSLADEVLTKVRAIARAPRPRLGPPVTAAAPAASGAQAWAEPLRPPSVKVEDHLPRTTACEAVLIGASTGGPAALQEVVPRLPAGLAASVFIVQHIPKGFTKSLAERLAARSALPVREAQDGELVRPGVVLVAPAGIHMKLRRRGTVVRVELDEEPRLALHRPSVDVLMQSASQVYGPRALGIVLTGMGSDGAAGLGAIQMAGGRTFAESEETCVIYGMPKAAVEAGVVDQSVPLGRMAAEIVAAV